jgi:hypothetical protein
MELSNFSIELKTDSNPYSLQSHDDRDVAFRRFPDMARGRMDFRSRRRARGKTVRQVAGWSDLC